MKLTDAERQERAERREADRAWVQATASCPRCHAYLEEPCVGRNGRPRRGNHLERVHLATRGLLRG